MMNKTWPKVDSNDGKYFYNRSDHQNILDEMSPVRHYINTARLEIKLYYLGLLTNLLCILVFTQKSIINRKSIFYLIFLAFSDFMYNFISLLPFALLDAKLAAVNIFKTSNVSCFFYDYITVIFHFYSVMITLFVTVDRFNHIYDPITFNRKSTSRKMKLFIGLSLFFLCTVIALPHGFLMVYNDQQKDCDGNKFFTNNSFTIGNSSINYYKFYFSITEPVLIWFIPGLIILCMNIYVIVKIFESKQWSAKLTSNRTLNTVSGTQPAQNVNLILYKSNLNRLYYGDQYEMDRLHYDRLESVSTNRQPHKAKFSLKNFRFYFLCFIRVNLDEMNKCTKEGVDMRAPHQSLDEYLLNKNNQAKRNKSLYLSDCKLNNSQSLSEKRRMLRKSATSGENMNLDQSATGSRLFRGSRLSVNQISHYITIIILGFYFILTTIPFAIVLSLQNDITLSLNYTLNSKQEYLNDSSWQSYAKLRDFVAFGRLFFISNHCFNFFLYFMFNRMFRYSIWQLLSNVRKFFSRRIFKLF